MKVVATVTARHTGDQSVSHSCNGDPWEDPTEGFRLVKEYPDEATYKRSKAQLTADAETQLLKLCGLTGHCRCRKLLVPVMPRWMDSVELSVSAGLVAGNELLRLEG